MYIVAMLCFLVGLFFLLIDLLFKYFPGISIMLIVMSVLAGYYDITSPYEVVEDIVFETMDITPYGFDNVVLSKEVKIHKTVTKSTRLFATLRDSTKYELVLVDDEI